MVFKIILSTVWIFCSVTTTDCEGTVAFLHDYSLFIKQDIIAKSIMLIIS